MKSEVWLVSQIEQIAAALIVVNPDPVYRAGVLALCVALGARPVHDIDLPRLFAWQHADREG